MNLQVTITTDQASRQYLVEKINWLLDMLDKEHHHANTHAQRNMYQAVIRHELEIMRDECDYGPVPNQSSDIPF